MGRLKGIASTRLGPAPPSRFGPPAWSNEAERSKARRVVSPWRNWYSEKVWIDLRWQVLVDALFTCAMCGRIEGNTSQLVGDHIKPHRGDRALFLDRSNLQCLCKACHDSKKQREERASGW